MNQKKAINEIGEMYGILELNEKKFMKKNQ